MTENARKHKTIEMNSFYYMLMTYRQNKLVLYQILIKRRISCGVALCFTVNTVFFRFNRLTAKFKRNNS